MKDKIQFRTTTKILFGLLSVVFVLFFLIALQRISGKNQITTIKDFTMGTSISATLYGQERDQAGMEIMERLKYLDEDVLSWREEQSELGRLNASFPHGKMGTASDEQLIKWIEQALELAKKSDGAFDPTIGPIVMLWGIETEHPAVPKKESIEEELKKTGYTKVSVQGMMVMTEQDDVTLNLGAVGKGIACDEVKRILEEYDVSGAVVSVGGSILVYGKKENHIPWNIAIRDPFGEAGDVFGVLKLQDGCVISTSGDYEKYFEQDGVMYHHIFDPETGYPADSGLASVTVVCENGLISDGLSTACFVLGIEKSKEVLEQYDAEAVFIRKDGSVEVTDGLQEYFVVSKEKESQGN